MKPRVGSIGYATDQGLAHLMRDFYRAGIVDRVMIYRHPHPNRITHGEWYPPGTPVLTSRRFAGRELDEFLANIDILLCFETPFDWAVLGACRERGVKSVLMTMYEWTLRHPPDQFDAYLCPSLLDYDVFNDRYPDPLRPKYGHETPNKGDHPAIRFIPVPANPDIAWHRRGPVRTYLHNAGHIGSRNHKGTEEVLKALPHVKSPISLTVRCQDAARFDVLRRSCLPRGDPRLRIQAGTIDYADLFPPEFDCYVAPEKFNGLSLPLQEAHAAGMVVMTTNRYPVNTWLTGTFVDPTEIRRVRVSPGYVEIEESVLDPVRLALEIDKLYERDGGPYSDAGREWAAANSWGCLKPRYVEFLESVCRG